MISISLLTLLLGADDCSLNEGVFKSQLDSTRLLKGARLEAQGRKDRVYRETLVYPDGMRVTLQVSCAHLGLSVERAGPRCFFGTMRFCRSPALPDKSA